MKVSSNSQVTQDRHIKVDVKKIQLPSSLEELAAWSRERWSALTTVMSVSSANSITSVVGTGIYPLIITFLALNKIVVCCFLQLKSFLCSSSDIFSSLMLLFWPNFIVLGGD